MRNTPDIPYNSRVTLLMALLAAGFVALLMVEPIPQPLAYHMFADQRSLLGIPNFNDTFSNIGFAIVGIMGVMAVATHRRLTLFQAQSDARPYIVFFAAIMLISLGSAYYHLDPSNERLFWDRLPMSIAFMAFVSAVTADRINRKAGNGWLLTLLVVLGVFSLVYWIETEALGEGDLRFYLFVQFFPIVLLPVVIWLFPEYRYTMGRYIGWVIAWYSLSKVLELYDPEVLKLTGGIVSGHSLKHLAAAAGALVVLRMLQSRHDKP